MSEQRRLVRSSFTLTPRRERSDRSELHFDVRIDQFHEVLEVVVDAKTFKERQSLIDTQELGVTIIPNVKASAVMPLLQALESTVIEFYPPSE